MKTLLISFFLLTLSACNSQPSGNRYKIETPALTAIKNSKEGFVVSYPTGWDTANLNPDIIFMAYDQRKDSTDKFRENMTLYKIKLEQPMSLENILKSAEVAFTAKYAHDNILTSTIKQNNHGLKYALMETLMHAEGGESVSCQTYFQKGDDVYVLGGAFDNSQYIKYHPMFEKIFSEFRFVQ